MTHAKSTLTLAITWLLGLAACSPESAADGPDGNSRDFWG